jgi:nitroreductase
MLTSVTNIEKTAPEFAQQFADMVRSRRSIRAFLPDRIDRHLLDELFSVAGTAPSNCNTQPWLVHVLSGASRDAMSAALLKTIGEGEHVLDFPYDAKYDGVYRRRQVEVGKMLYRALGVTREDTEGKRQAFLRNLEFFDAPHVVFLFMPDWGGIREALDVGIYAQNLMLAMLSHGIASCPQTILGYNAEVVRAQLNIEPEQKLLFGISFGYEDKSCPENQIRPTRATVAESVRFYD